MKTYKIRVNNTEYAKSQEEILQMNLSPDTLVWSKGFINWMKLRDVPELNPMKNESKSNKISQLFKGLKSQMFIKKQKEESPVITTQKESVADTNKRTATETSDGIILGEPTPKQTKKKMLWVVVAIMIVALVYAFLSFIPRGYNSNLFDAGDTDSSYLDTLCIDTVCVDTFYAD